MTLPFWILPLIATIVALFWPGENSGGSYDFIGPLVDLGLRLFVILIAWLVYFIIV